MPKKLNDIIKLLNDELMRLHDSEYQSKTNKKKYSKSLEHLSKIRTELI